MGFLNGLPECIDPLPSNTPKELAEAWFAKLDANANRFAPQFRRVAAIPILCTAAAALVGWRVSFAGSNVIWLWMAIVLGVIAAGLPVLIRLTHRRNVWTRVRTAAEVCRSCLALWHTPALYDVIGPEVVPELAGMLASLNFLKSSGRASCQTSFEEFKRVYWKGRLQHQIDYYSRHASRSAAKIRRYRIVMWGSIALANGANFWILLHAHERNSWVRGSWELALTLAAMIAAVAGALLIVNDHERRRGRYRELHRILTQWDKELALSRTWPIVLRITSLVERALLAELIEWRSLFRHIKLAQE